MKKMNLAILGLGQMGEAIARGILNSADSNAFSLVATTRSQESALEARNKFSFPIYTDNARAIRESDVILLCVKPHQGLAILEKHREDFSNQHLVISICASLTTQRIRESLPAGVRVLRSMPNTPCLIGSGITALAKSPGLADTDLELGEKLFGRLGDVVRVEESLMDAVTGLSGCGPAYVYLIVEALSDAGVKVGLPRKIATQLAAHTLMGSARMVIERGVHPASLKDEVTTPAGCTVDGLMALEDGGLRVTLIKAVVAATRRSGGLVP